MDTEKIKELAFELYKNEDVAIELANIIFGIRDGDYDEPIPDKVIVRCWDSDARGYTFASCTCGYRYDDY